MRQKKLALHIQTPIFIIFILSQSGCKKFVQVDVPATKLVSTSVFSNGGTATSALLNIYQQMYSNQESCNLEWQTGLMGDEMTNYTTLSYFVDFYTNSLFAVPTGTYGPWITAYNYMYQANGILDGLHNNPSIAPAIRNQLTGEAKFVRAFWFFYLTNCYGDIPMPLSSDYSVNKSLSRNAQAQVYQQIVSDLKDAQSLLNSNFVDASDTAVSTDRIRPTKWAATALLARVYLYVGDFADAEAQANAVIGNTSQFSLLPDLRNVFLVNSKEAIWQLGIPTPNLYDTWEALNFTLTSVPSVYALSNQLITSFEPNDGRMSYWVGSFTTPGPPASTYYYPAKYKSTTSAILEYTMVLRLGEQYLIRAEARAQQGNTNGALTDLDAIRNRAGLANYSGNIDQGSVLTAILHERQVELFSEWGHRWFDMIRTETIGSIMGAPGNVCLSKGGTWSANWKLFPIPQSEINNDPNLTQNSGY